jgi:hypothetical protein
MNCRLLEPQDTWKTSSEKLAVFPYKRVMWLVFVNFVLVVKIKKLQALLLVMVNFFILTGIYITKDKTWVP